MVNSLSLSLSLYIPHFIHLARPHPHSNVNNTLPVKASVSLIDGDMVLVVLPKKFPNILFRCITVRHSKYTPLVKADSGGDQVSV